MYGSGDYSGYSRQGGPLDSVIMRLVIANAAVFLVQQIPVGGWMAHYLALTPKLVLTRGYVWQMVTYLSLIHI